MEEPRKLSPSAKLCTVWDVSANLLSISRLDKEGWKVTFGGGKADFVDPGGKAQFTASMFNDLYKIDCELMRGDEYTALAARSLEHSVLMKHGTCGLLTLV